MRICLAQLPVTDDVTLNTESIVHAVDYASENRADVLLTPEGSVSGYTHVFDSEAVISAVDRIVGRATAANLALALGTCFVEPDNRCYNQIRFYGKTGDFIGAHSKILRCASWEKSGVGELYDFATTPLRVFNLLGTSIGGLICNDLWANPQCTIHPDEHLSQQLGGKGAKIIFHAVNGGRDKSDFSKRIVRNFHESNLLIRAKSARVYIATVDSSFPEHLHCSSRGGIVDPNGEWLGYLPERGKSVQVFDVSEL